MANQFLIKNTMADMRALSAAEITALTNGTYSGVQLLGYYQAGDTPCPINYYLSSTTDPDDGGSVIAVGSIKLQTSKESIDLSHFGAIADGDEINYSGTDNKLKILNALSYISKVKGHLTINGKYFSSSFEITNSNLNIKVTAGSYLIFKPSYTNSQDRSLKITGGASNINIEGYGAKFVSPEDYDNQFRHVVTLLNCIDVNISGIECIGGGGDGWYIGNDIADQLPTNITLTDIKATRSRRNGIGFINGHNVRIIRPICRDVRGTAPMAGIDIEANEKDIEKISGLRIIDPVTENNAVGLLFTMGTFTKQAAKSMDIIITGHQSIKDDVGTYINGFGSANPWINKLTGYIKYQGSIIKSKNVGLSLSAWDIDKAPPLDIDVYIEDAGNGVVGSGAAQDLQRSPIVIFASYDATFDIGNFNINAKIRDTRTTPLHYTGVYLANDVKAIKNLNIRIDTDNRRTSAYDLFSYNGTTTGNIAFVKQPEYSISSLLSLENVCKTFGGRVIINTAGTQQIPLSSNWIGSILEFKQNIANSTNISCQNGDSMLIDGAKTNYLVLTEQDQSIKLLATKEGWQLIGGNLMRASTWPNRPTITTGTLLWFNKTDQKIVFWNGTTWININ
ncbi:hypothetical protein [Sphingobacterium multivorum]|uniref:hypothetical protein n=1 Tax=Sphingobacterium multivorum TaxID=28454 RepID=UPI0031BBA98C